MATKKWMQVHCITNDDGDAVERRYIPLTLYRKIYKSMKPIMESVEEYYNENTHKYVMKFTKKSGLHTVFELTTYVPLEDAAGGMCYRARD